MHHDPQQTFLCFPEFKDEEFTNNSSKKESFKVHQDCGELNWRQENTWRIRTREASGIEDPSLGFSQLFLNAYSAGFSILFYEEHLAREGERARARAN